MGLHTAFKFTSINIEDLVLKLIFKMTGNIPVLELIYLHGTPGLTVGCDPVMVP